jgi:hypothetical protein
MLDVRRFSFKSATPKTDYVVVDCNFPLFKDAGVSLVFSLELDRRGVLSLLARTERQLCLTWCS